MSLKALFYVLILILAILGYRLVNKSSASLKLGQAAPVFELADAQGKTHALSDYVDKWLVVYFYPKDDTPGCTKEACHFRDDSAKFTQAGAAILGVSVDDGASHANFAQKYKLPFPLLVDNEGKMAAQYGALANLGVMKIAKRHTFLIAPNQTIAKIYTEVNPSQHSQEILRDIAQLSEK